MFDGDVMLISIEMMRSFSRVLEMAKKSVGDLGDNDLRGKR
jgi:hypothetical protein